MCGSNKVLEFNGTFPDPALNTEGGKIVEGQEGFIPGSEHKMDSVEVMHLSEGIEKI